MKFWNNDQQYQQQRRECATFGPGMRPARPINHISLVLTGLGLIVLLTQARCPIVSAQQQTTTTSYIVNQQQFSQPRQLSTPATRWRHLSGSLHNLINHYHASSSAENQPTTLPNNSNSNSNKTTTATTATATTKSSNNNYNNNWLPRGSLRKALHGLQNPRLILGDVLIRTGPINAGTNNGRRGRLIKFERSALVSPINLWPNGVIYYELDASVVHLVDLIWSVMQQFQSETCIRFILREANEPDYLRIEALRGCFSYIGRIGGEQTLSLGDGCEFRGTIAHELLHAVGFFHHQNRSDRDDYLEIIWDNIAKGKENQFLKMAPQENILLNEFDYDSIMLYGPHTFGKTLDKVTMKPKREGVILLEVVEKQGLSALDISSVNKLYKCETQNTLLSQY